MIRIARYSVPRTTLGALSVTAVFVFALFVATLLTHLPAADSAQVEVKTQESTLKTLTNNNNPLFIQKVIKL